MSDLLNKADELDVHLDGQDAKIAELRRLIAKERLEIFREQERIQARQDLIIRAESAIKEIEKLQIRARSMAVTARKWEERFGLKK